MQAAPPLQPQEGRAIGFGAFTFDRVSGILRRDGVEVPLPPRVLGVLVLLLDRPDEVVTKQDLITAVWRDAFVTETSIAEAISVLRQTLGDDPQRPTYIQTLHRRGYRFIAALQDGAPAVVAPARRPGAEPSVPLAASVEARQPEPLPRLHLLVPWLVALFSLLLAATAVWRYLGTASPAAAVPVRFTVALPPGLVVAPTAAPLAVANDGSMLAFAGCDGSQCAIYLRPMSQSEITPVAGTTGGAAPFFSADGRSLGFFAKGTLRTIALGGGAPVTVVPVTDALGAAWLRDGQIVFARGPGEGLFVASPNGDAVRALTTPARGEGGHRWPVAVADASAVVFSVAATPAGAGQQYGAVVSMRTGSWGRVIDDAGAVAVAAQDFLVAQRPTGLVASWFDRRTHSVVGLPVAVAAPALAGGLASFAVNDAGTLAVVSPARDAVHVVLNWAQELNRQVPAPPPALPR